MTEWVVTKGGRVAHLAEPYLEALAVCGATLWRERTAPAALTDD